MRGTEEQAHRAAPLTEAAGFFLYGEYGAEVQLEGGYTGVHTDALEPEPGDMGAIDLALTLEQAGDNVSGHVLLQNTLVFTQEHTLSGGRSFLC